MNRKIESRKMKPVKVHPPPVKKDRRKSSPPEPVPANDALREAIFLLDREGRILRCNKAFRDIVQKPFQDIIGRPCHEVVHGASQFIPDCPFIKMKESRIRETMTISRNGRWHQLTADPVWDEEDKLLFAVHVMADISDARRAEEDLRQSAERIRDLYDHAPCGYHSLDKDGLFVEINETELGWLDYTREELVAKKAFADISTAAGRSEYRPDPRLRKTVIRRIFRPAKGRDGLSGARRFYARHQGRASGGPPRHRDRHQRTKTGGG